MIAAQPAKPKLCACDVCCQLYPAPTCFGFLPKVNFIRNLLLAFAVNAWILTTLVAPSNGIPDAYGNKHCRHWQQQGGELWQLPKLGVSSRVTGVKRSWRGHTEVAAMIN